jgi:cobalt-zinc-cadmium efflux system membrane fusion protein
MINRPTVALLAALAGLAISIAVPSIPLTARRLMGAPVVHVAASVRPATSTQESDAGKRPQADEGKIVMTAAQAVAAAIQVAPASGGVMLTRVAVPGVLAANQDHMARVTARVSGTVAEVLKGLGEPVAKGDVLAVIESRDIADAKGEFLGATRTAALAETTLAREASLWKKRISAEQDFLQARASAEEARIRVDLARQRLSALGLSEDELTLLPRQPVVALRRLEMRAPISGQVIARVTVLGAAVGSEAELFTIADLSTLWVEMAISPRDLPTVRLGQSVIVSGDGDTKGEGRIVLLSPLLDPETRSARAVAELANADGQWRPGGFASVSLSTVERKVATLIPRTALQEIDGKKVVFARTAEGFQRREVQLGEESGTGVEIVSGLDHSAEIAVSNTFLLKAELGKAQAED